MVETLTCEADALLHKIDRFSDAQVLCIGDVMLDRFIYGSVDRISPEAPIPVVKYERESVMLGGAGNVVRNISSLGGSGSFIAVVGTDEAGTAITGLTGEHERVFPYLLSDKKRISTEKTRYIGGSQQLFRTDKESTEPMGERMRNQINDVFNEEVAGHKVAVLSDYGKGMFTVDALTAMIAKANSHDVRVVIDPKSADFGVYRQSFLLTPNLKELEAACGKKLTDQDEIIAEARALIAAHNIENILVTCGAKGMFLVTGDPESPAQHIAARAREVFDVSGAGDTVVATLAVALASGCSLEESAFLANAAAGIVVAKIGTAAVYRTDLKAAIHTSNAASGSRKIFPADIAAAQVEAWQRDGLKVGFTNGCFDLVHTGHLASVNDAKKLCDRLVIAINADASIKRLKGDDRPVNSEMDRAMLLAELAAVDMVVIFREDTPEVMLEKLRPDVLMKGEDYQKHEIVGAEFVESYGGTVERIPLKEGYSTTNTIQKIRNSGE